MSDQDHVEIEDIVSASRRPDGRGVLARHVLRHLVEVCPDCRAEWIRLGKLRPILLERLGALRAATPPIDRNEILATPAEIDLQAALVDRLQQLHKNALNELSDLRRTPPPDRPALIRRARTRFRSPLLADLVIEECRKCVRNAPAEAADLAGLVPDILSWALGERPVPSWAPPLLARAAAHRANGLRVAGDLPAAERAFAELRRRLADHPLAEPVVIAEIDSLEASLCIGQRRLQEAAALLERAMLSFRVAGDDTGIARAQVKLANLLQTTGRPAATLRLLDSEGLPLDPTSDLHLYLCAVTVRANALCDLARFDEAGELLVDQLDHYEQSDDPYVAAIYRCLRGRVDLGQGRSESAVEAFRDSRDAMLTLGRCYDAALITLFLSQALLAAGKTRELRQLAQGLVAAFASRQVEDEVLATLRLLARAVMAEQVTVKLLDKLHRRLTSPASPRWQPAD